MDTVRAQIEALQNAYNSLFYRHESLKERYKRYKRCHWGWVLCFVIALLILFAVGIGLLGTTLYNQENPPIPTPECAQACVYTAWSAWTPVGPCSINPTTLTCTQSLGRSRNLTSTCPIYPPPTTCTATVAISPTNVSCSCPVNATMCTTSAECADANACTQTACESNVCVVKNTTNCTAPDLCTVSTCNTTTGTCDLSALDCNDNNNCTVDACDPLSGCVHTVITTPVTVFIGETTILDYCHLATCIGTSGDDWNISYVQCDPGYSCSPPDPSSSCHPVCNDTAGECDFIAPYQQESCTIPVCQAPASWYGGRYCNFNTILCIGTVCNTSSNTCVADPPPCPVPVICDAGTYFDNFTCSCRCTPASCNALVVNTSCSVATCNSTAGTCSVAPRVCNDSNACTTDQCLEGIGCINTARICATPDICETSYCDASSGTCVFAPAFCPSDTGVSTCSPSTGCAVGTPCPTPGPCQQTVFLGTGVCSTVLADNCCYNAANESETGIACPVNSRCTSTTPGAVGTCTADNIVVSQCINTSLATAVNGSLLLFLNASSSSTPVYLNGLSCSTGLACTSGGTCMNGACVAEMACGIVNPTSFSCFHNACINGACSVVYDNYACYITMPPFILQQPTCNPTLCPSSNYTCFGGLDLFGTPICW